MARKINRQNYCVGCPQGCVHCGREKDVITNTLLCDKCGDVSTKLYVFNDKEYCNYCLLKQVIEQSEKMKYGAICLMQM